MGPRARCPQFAIVDQRAEVLQRSEEAFRRLAALVAACPAGLARSLPVFRRPHLDRCRALGRAPDAELLAPVDEVLARLGLDEEGD